MIFQRDYRQGSTGAALLAVLYAAAIAVLLVSYFAFEPPRGLWVNLLTAVFTWVFFLAATMQGSRAARDIQGEQPEPAVMHGFWAVSAVYSLAVIIALFIWLPQGGQSSETDTAFLVFLGLFTILGASVSGTLYSWGTRLQQAEAPAQAARQEHRQSGMQLNALLAELQRLAPPTPELNPAFLQATRDLRKCAQALQHSHGGWGGDKSRAPGEILTVSNAAEESALAIRQALRLLGESQDPVQWQSGMNVLTDALQGMLRLMKSERML